MKDLLLNPDRSIYWKAIVILILSNSFSSIVIQAFHWNEYYDITQFGVGTVKGIVLNLIMFLLWAWLVRTQQPDKNPVLRTVIGALIIGIVMGCLSSLLLMLTSDKEVVLRQDDLVYLGISCGDYFVLVLLCELLSRGFRNKVFLYCVISLITYVLYDYGMYLFHNSFPLHANLVIFKVYILVVYGFTTAYFFRLFKVKASFYETPVMQVRHEIVRQLKAGKQKLEIWQEIKDTSVFQYRKLAKIFTAVSYPDDVKQVSMSQGVLVIYTFLSAISMLRFTKGLFNLRYDSRYILDPDAWIACAALIFMTFQFYLLYQIAHHRAFVYRIITLVSTVMGILALLASIQKGWFFLVSGVIHLIVAWIAYRVSSYVYQNYRLFYMRKEDDGTYAL